jgi:hypothetical protein
MSEKDDELKKAIAFLLSKEMKEYSLDKKKEFLLKKLPKEVVDKAVEIYPTIENNVKENLEAYKNKQSESSFSFSNFFDVGILSTVLLSTLGINYLLDLNRNKKNEMFYHEAEKKLNEELQKQTNEMKNQIGKQLNEYVSVSTYKNQINSQIVEFTQQKGLNLNLSSKSLKEDVVAMKTDLSETDKKLKELGVKVDNNSLLLKQDLLRDFEKMIEENNKKILIKIIENQNKLLSMCGDKSMIEKVENRLMDVNTEINQSEKISMIIENNQMIDEPTINEGKVTILDDNQDSKHSDNYFNENTFTNKENGIKTSLDTLLETLSSDSEKNSLIQIIKNQISKILESVEGEEENSKIINSVNLSNKNYKNINNEKMAAFLISSGFTTTYGSKTFTTNKQEVPNLRLAKDLLDKY